MHRSRPWYLFFVILTIILGLGSRTQIVPEWIFPYLGDYLYAVMYFLILGFLFPQMLPLRIAVWSVLLCYFIEILQLYQADWINAIRSTRLGGLILGYGFLWSDILAYTLGGLTAYWIEMVIYTNKSSS